MRREPIPHMQPFPKGLAEPEPGGFDAARRPPKFPGQQPTIRLDGFWLGFFAAAFACSPAVVIVILDFMRLP